MDTTKMIATLEAVLEALNPKTEWEQMTSERGILTETRIEDRYTRSLVGDPVQAQRWVCRAPGSDPPREARRLRLCWGAGEKSSSYDVDTDELPALIAALRQMAWQIQRYEGPADLRTFAYQSRHGLKVLYQQHEDPHAIRIGDLSLLANSEQLGRFVALLHGDPDKFKFDEWLPPSG